MESLSTELQDLIKKVTKDNGIANFELEISNTASKEGDGYIGIVEALNISDKDSDKKLNLIIKRAPTSANLRKQFPTRPAFLREIIIYDQVFPEFKQFQEERNIPHPFDSVPALYGYNSDEFKEVLLLQNLKLEGFKLWNRKTPMDQQHLSIVLKTYAKFHAVSLAMKKLEPERYEKVISLVKSNMIDNFKNSTSSSFTDEVFGDHEDSNGKITGGFWQPAIDSVKDSPRLLEALLEQKKNIFIRFEQQMEAVAKDEHSVLGHCDCWSANMLFKYEDESNLKIPSKATIIDWQLACLTHLVNDVSSFFFINSGKEDLKNYKDYLKIYHTALSENLATFGLDCFYSFELFEKDWVKYSFSGFFFCLIMLEQCLSDEKPHDYQKLAEEGRNIFSSKIDSKKSELFYKRMKDLVEFVVDNKLL